MIFVDGPDGVGKTGYSHFLSDELGWPRLEMRPVADTDCIEAKSEVFNATIRDLYDQDVDLVVDRGSVSSIVYSSVFGRDQPKHAWKTLKHVEPTIIYLRCDPDELAIRYGNTDEIFDVEEVRKVAEVYDNVMTNLEHEDFVDIRTIDTTAGAPSKITEIASGVIHGD